MDDTIVAGIFAIVGVIVGYLLTILTENKQANRQLKLRELGRRREALERFVAEAYPAIVDIILFKARTVDEVKSRSKKITLECQLLEAVFAGDKRIAVVLAKIWESIGWADDASEADRDRASSAINEQFHELVDVLADLNETIALGGSLRPWWRFWEVTQRTRLLLLGACIGGLVYISGGFLLFALFDSDAVIIAWWALLTFAALVVIAWLKRPRNDNA